MDPLIPVVVAILGLIASNGFVGFLLVGLYRSVAAERSAWQHERWELNTRLAAPDTQPPLIAPPAPLPTQRPAETPPVDENDTPATELHLVGTIVGNG